MRHVWEKLKIHNLQNFSRKIFREIPVRSFYIHGSVHRDSDLITVQQDATYSVYYISVGSSTCFGCWHPPSGVRPTVITASGTGQPGLLPSALVVEMELIQTKNARNLTCGF